MKTTKAMIIGLVVIALAGGMISGLSSVQNEMNALREENGLTVSEPLENAPPLVAFTTVALGGFRGLLADWLWLRMDRMQTKANYFEVVQLASWIVKLQPRFTGATAFMAWNMAYNISVTFSSYEDRWRWVKRGIELIRNEALLYNPGDPELYRQLAWIYQHKMGQNLDDANRYYKLQLAQEMMRVVGPWPVNWSSLAQMPYRTEEFLELHSLENSWLADLMGDKSLKEIEKYILTEGNLPQDIARTLESEYPELRDPTELFFRNRCLRNQLRLEAQKILELNQLHGDLDWRLPEAHAIYWASKGLDAADEELSLVCDRVIFQSLKAAFKSGRLIFLKEGKTRYLEMTPNVDIVDAVNEKHLEAIERHGESGVRDGYNNFLIDATVQLYFLGRKTKAAEYFKKGRSDPDMRRRFGNDIEKFILKELSVDMSSPTYELAQGAVRGYLLGYCANLANGEIERAVSFERIATKLYLKYMDKIGKGGYDRRGLPPYPQIKKHVIAYAKEIFPSEHAAALIQALPESGEEPATENSAEQPSTNP